MIRFFPVVMLMLLLTACIADTPATPTPVPMQVCGDFQIAPDDRVFCGLTAVGTALLQTPADAQVTLPLKNASVTLDGTLYSYRSGTALVLLVLEGTLVLSAQESTRILQAGSQVALVPDDSGDYAIQSDAQPGDVMVLADVPLDALPRAMTLPPALQRMETITLPQVTSPPESPGMLVSPSAPDLSLQAEATQAVSVDGCPIPDGWDATHTVSPGEVLSRIARDYGITVDDIQTGNCLDNPDRLRVGQTLRVPGESAVITPEAVPGSDAATPTPSAVLFRADRVTLNAGDCTTLRWDVYNVPGATLDEEAVPTNGVREICPEMSTTYTLRVNYPDESETTHSVTVTVTE